MKILIKNGRIIDPHHNFDKITDILIENTKIVQIKDKITTYDAKVIEAKNKIIIPGIIDLHTHLREPGREDEETIESGTLAAAHGGITSLLTMPNTQPVCDNQSVVKYILKQAQKKAYVNVYVCGAISKNLEGKELADLGELKKAGVIAISDDGNPVADSHLMRRAMEYVKMLNLPIISHCEDKMLSKDGVMNEGYFSTILGLPGIPHTAEEIMINRDIMLAKLTETKLHITHLSTKDGVELVRLAKREGIKITCDTCPHYFSLTDERLINFDTSAKVNPPLRSKEDVEAIKEGLKDGTIDCIVTDHAPHSRAEKEVEFLQAPFGLIGLETLLPLIVTFLIKPKILSLSKAIEKITINPAKILNLSKDSLSIGNNADITIIDLTYEKKITEEYFKSKSKNSPFIGEKLTGFPIITLVAGKIVFDELTEN